MPKPNERGHIFGNIDPPRVCVPILQAILYDKKWLYYEGCRNPWRLISKLEHVSDGKFRIDFPDGTFRLLPLSEKIYVELGK